MSEEMKPVDWKETLILHGRCYRDIYKFCPQKFWASGIGAVVEALSPYVTVYLSAQIINELAHLRRPQELMRWVLLTLLLEAAIGLAKAAVTRWKSAINTIYNPKKERIFLNKFLDMDYADVDKQEVRDLRSQITQSEQWAGWGINRAVVNFENILHAGFGVLGAIALTVSMFTMKVPETETDYLWLNHPLAVAGFVLALLLIVAITPVLTAKNEKLYAKISEAARFGNRAFSCFGFIAGDLNRALDFRMYNQAAIAKHYMKKCNSFGVGSLSAKYSAGEEGIRNGIMAGGGALITGVVYAFVGLKAWAGAFGVGSVTQYVSAITALTVNASGLFQSLGNMSVNTLFLRTIYEFLDIPNEMYQGSLTTEKRADRQ